MRQEVWLRPGHSIWQDDQYFKLSQDSVLLAAFARPRSSWKGMDLCCGVGPVGGLTYLRSGCLLDGLELQEGAARLAEENFARLGMEDSRVYCCDLRQLPPRLADRYQFCVCNPPYFGSGRGQRARSEKLALARSEQGCTIEQVCAAAARLLRTGGLFWLCYKPERLAALMTALRSQGLEPKRLRMVQHSRSGNAVLALVEARKGAGEWLEVEPPLVVAEDDGRKTREWKMIYGIEE